ncbi:MAG: hypothetical protein LBS82_00075 [Spirochaetaceae bacterium]|jgi:hypothetical protein|nr:hypothetical protein [Spirochaetaceae bacterium]
MVSLSDRRKLKMGGKNDNIESRIKSLLDYYVDFEQDPRFARMVWAADGRLEVLADDQLAMAAGGLSSAPDVPELPVV